MLRSEKEICGVVQENSLGPLKRKINSAIEIAPKPPDKCIVYATRN
jgi:hypothetical protein